MGLDPFGSSDPLDWVCFPGGAIQQRPTRETFYRDAGKWRSWDQHSPIGTECGLAKLWFTQYSGTPRGENPASPDGRWGNHGGWLERTEWGSQSGVEPQAGPTLIQILGSPNNRYRESLRGHWGPDIPMGWQLQLATGALEFPDRNPAMV